MVTRRVVVQEDNFDRAQTYTTTPAGHMGWTLKDTSTAGAPTALNITEDGGAAKLTLAADSEAEILTLYQGDVLPYDLALLQHIEFVAKVAGIDAVTQLLIGVGSAQNDTADSVAINAWFRIDGTASTSAVVVETDDGATDNNDVATGLTLGSTYKKFEIDFTHGITDVRFYIDGQRVAASTTFSLAGITSGQNVQLFVQLQKASGTGVPSVTITKAMAQYKTADGA